MRQDVYGSVTDRILAALEQGTAPWRRPWVGGGPINVRSGRPYRGINIFLLGMTEYGDPRWGTFKAMQETAVKTAIDEGREIITETRMVGGYPKVTYFEIVNGEKVWFGGGVRKGEKGTSIILWKTVQKKRASEGDEAADDTYRLLRMYSVFNAEQVDGLPEYVTEYEHEPIERAQMVVDGYVGPAVLYGGDRAYYSPPKDLVRCPELGQFHTAEGFYSTLYHELVHSTGHEKRLARLEPALFGTDPYAKEELVAEMGAAMLCGVAGIDNQDESASYVHGWLKRLQDDRKLVVSAAAQAQKACDLILGTTFGEMEEPQQQLVLA